MIKCYNLDSLQINLKKSTYIKICLWCFYKINILTFIIKNYLKILYLSKYSNDKNSIKLISHLFINKIF